MEERSYPPPDFDDSSRLGSGNRIIFIVIIIAGLLLPILLMTSPFESVVLSLTIFFPMVCLLLIVVLGCNRERSPAYTNADSDDRVLESMRRRAVPVSNRDRCPECENYLELQNARYIDDNVVLCPFCGTRLYLG